MTLYADEMQYADLLLLAGDCRHTAGAIFKYFREHTAPHLFRSRYAIDVQPSRRDIVDASLEAHQALILLDSRSNGDESSGHIVTVCKIVFGNNGRRPSVIHVHVRIFLEFTDRLDPIVRGDKQIGVFVDVVENHPPQHFVEAPLLIGEGIYGHRIDLWVVTYVVRLDRIKPVTYTILAGPHKRGEKLSEKSLP